MKAALYIRVSTEEQAIHGLSIAAQTEALDEWAKANGATVVDHYVDAGISARKSAAKRPELQRLLKDVQAGRVDIIVFTKLDRWFRNIAEYYKVQEVLDKHKVKWRAIHEDYETETSGGQFKVNIMLSVAQNEADKTGERIKAVFDGKKARGEVCSGSVPPGIRIENKHCVADEPMASAVQDLFSHYIATQSLYKTRIYAGSKYNLYRDSKTFRRMLGNARYRGLVVDEATFDLAQSMLSARAQRHSCSTLGNTYLFRGLMRCPECGSAMNACVCKNIYYYRCSLCFGNRKCSYNLYTREDKVEAFLLANIMTKCTEYNAEIAGREKEEIDYAGIRRRMAKLKDLYLSDLIERDEYEHDYRELRKILETPQTAPKPIDIAQVRSSLTDYDELTRDGRKEFWTRTISEISPSGRDFFNITVRKP